MISEIPPHVRHQDALLLQACLQDEKIYRLSGRIDKADECRRQFKRALFNLRVAAAKEGRK